MENTDNYATVWIDGVYKSTTGCQQYIHQNYKVVREIKILVEKKFIDLFLTQFKNFDKLFQFWKELGFEFQIEQYSNDTVFVFKNPECIPKIHYYAFCLVRMLYMFNTIFYEIFKKYVPGNACSIIGEYPSYNLCSRGWIFNKNLMFKGLKVQNGLGQSNFVMRKEFDIEKYGISDNKTDIYFMLNGKIQFLEEKNNDYEYKKGTSNSVVSIYSNGSLLCYDLILNINMTKTLKPKPEIHFPTILSRHPSHNVFRKSFKTSKKALIRLGSTTVKDESKYEVVINSIKSITNSSNKLLMKESFEDYEVQTAPWWTFRENHFWYKNNDEGKEMEFPIVAKNIFGSRGTGNHKLNTQEELNNFILSKKGNLKNYIFEKYMNYGKEYRVHVSTNGVFLVWRKLRKKDSTDFWYFNNQNCNWISESNSLFDTPKCYKEMLNECIKALHSVGLTIGGVDIRVQTNNQKNPKFSVIEINSACSQAEQTSKAYIEEFKRLCK